MNQTPNFRVIKLGGSLLMRRNLGSDLQSWLGKQSPAVNVILTGGGELAEEVRRWDAVHPLAEEQCHWLAIEMMGVTAKLTGYLLPQSVPVTSLAEIKNAETNTLSFDPRDWLKTEKELPANWSATSDSIAAFLARSLNANELVLLKSCLPPASNLFACAVEGYVDEYFPQAAKSIPRIRCVSIPTNEERALET